jgi:hypothetical protein
LPIGVQLLMSPNRTPTTLRPLCFSMKRSSLPCCRASCE